MDENIWNFDIGNEEVTGIPRSSWEKETAVHGRTKADFEAKDEERNTESKAQRAQVVEPLFLAYMQDKTNTHAQNDLLGWVMAELTGAAKRKYGFAGTTGKPGYGDWESRADERAADVTIDISEKLDAGAFPSYKSLLSYMALKIKFFSSDAFEDKKKTRHLEPLITTRTDERGKKSQVESWIGRLNLAAISMTPMQRIQSGQSLRLGSDKEAIQTCLSEKEQELCEAIGGGENGKAGIMRRLGITDNTLDQRIKRLTDHVGELNALMMGLSLPCEPKVLLAGRFLRLVSRLMGMSKAALPATFEEVKVLALETAEATGPERTTRKQVVRHLEALWAAQ